MAILQVFDCLCVILRLSVFSDAASLRRAFGRKMTTSFIIGSSKDLYPDEYSLDALQKEKDQAHPDVITLTACMTAVTAARLLIQTPP